MRQDSDAHRSSGGAETVDELTSDLTETARVLFAGDDVHDTLAHIVDLGVSTVEGCDYAGIFLADGATIVTPVHSDPIVDAIDDLQRSTGEGPCLDAVARQVIFYADDLASDDSWPTFGPRAVQAGVRSVLALPLATSAGSGALNLYARSPGAFGVVDRAKGVILASLASLALSAAYAHEDDDRRTSNLVTALTTREIIGQAQGILMERERISGDQAFDILRRASQHLNRKLRDVAQDLVDTGEQPDTGRPPTTP